MDRRRFVVSTISCSCVAFSLTQGIFQATATQFTDIGLITSESMLKILMDINDAVYGLKDGIEYTKWAIDSASALEVGQSNPAPPSLPHVPPAPPFGWTSDSFAAHLKDTLTKVRAFDLPALNAPLPPIGNVALASNDAFRSDLRARYNTWIDAAQEVAQAIQVLAALQALAKAARSHSFAISRARDVIEETISTRLVWMESVRTQLAAEVLAFTGYLSASGEIEDAIQLKTIDLTKSIKGRLTNVAGSAKELLGVLALEQAKIKADADELNRRAADLKTREEALKQLEAELSNLKIKASKINNRITALRSAFTKTDTEIQQYEAQIPGINEQVRNLRRQLSAPYTVCPIHKTHDQCGGPDCGAPQIKQNWDAHIGFLKVNLDNTQRNLNEIEGIIKDLTDAQNKISTEIDGYVANLKSMDDQYATISSDHDGKVNEYKREKEKYEKDRVTSRCDIYYDESARESAQVTQTLMDLAI